jgi:hypothetical protein
MEALMTHRMFWTGLAVAAALAVGGCAAEPMSPQDAAALAVLGEVAGPTSNVPADRITSTECWLPSEHPIEDDQVDRDTLWRVLCRVNYRDSTGDRYQDTTCIGDFAADPMLDHCYRWTHYDFAEQFGDHPAVSAG